LRDGVRRDQAEVALRLQERRRPLTGEGAHVTVCSVALLV
jgi:hypothetical protein